MKEVSTKFEPPENSSKNSGAFVYFENDDDNTPVRSLSGHGVKKTESQKRGKDTERTNTETYLQRSLCFYLKVLQARILHHKASNVKVQMRSIKYKTKNYEGSLCQ